ncbi:MAG: hypothetical protein ACI3Y2_07080 [Candidatus Egerieousia sp.]
MKKSLAYMIMTIAAMVLFSCGKEDILQPGSGNDLIILQISSSDARSRAINEDVLKEIEEKIELLDIFIFDNGNLVTHEKFGEAKLKGGRVFLRKRRSELTANKRYWVYLIANSREDLDGVSSLADLRSKRCTDQNIHMTGMTVNGVDIPQTFIMDGIAYDGATEPATPGSVVLYDGVKSHNTELTVNLKRAAAKIVVKITGEESVNFTAVEGNRRGYYMRNMPYETTLLSEVTLNNPRLRTPDKSNAERFFEMNEENNTIDIVTYAYSYVWKDKSQTEQTNLLVNIPMLVAKKITNPDGSVEFEKDSEGKIVWEEKALPENWYRVPLSQEQSLKRNHCYQLSFKINAPGANSEFEPVDIKDIDYTVIGWGETKVDLGGSESKPIFLYLNHDELDMHNVADDKTSILFSSSSKITVTVKSAYYYDKLGKKQPVSTSITSQITAKSAEANALSGAIDIHIPVPTNNTIQYVEFEVTNEEGEIETFLVHQFPLEYITNIQGWYSYRSDFEGTHYESFVSSRYVTAGSYNSSSGTWSYSKSSGSGNFTSKVAEVKSDGSSTISYYEYQKWVFDWFNSGYKDTDTPQLSSAGSNLNNARMYHIRITSTSDEYIVGKPRITDGVTDPGEDNAKLVSPSFMIASQLGAVSGFNSVAMAASHCKEYVEAYKDPETGKTVHLDDWRLPTEAELLIIKKYQTASDAMDKVLTGNNYYAASGSVYIGGGNSGTAIRCIRDAYDDRTK